ncbi:hypothetical protein E2C01_026577 [Portunus trituberculatus]|uniref:Uncharacterized protein n=1 Tax=Portunus trituberculatus TaxID=210409 RepID=A0A5B7ELC6_PORTR|nr:hypothetical protein [Portunus trituberculatus]
MGTKTHPPHMVRPHSHLLTDGRGRKREVETGGLVRAKGGTDNDSGLRKEEEEEEEEEDNRPWTAGLEGEATVGSSTSSGETWGETV